MIELSDQHRQFQELIRSFARREVMPRASSRDENAEDPAGILRQLAELGATGITVPVAYGGLGLDATTLIVTIEELGYADASVGSALGGHYLAMEGFLLVGDDAVKAKYLPGLVSGELRAAFALTEPDAGGHREHAEQRGTRRQGLAPQRHEDLHKQRQRVRRHAGFREDRS